MPPLPDWLKTRDGLLKPGLGEHIVLVMLNDQPQYRLETRPANGKFACTVSQTVNGKRLDDGATYGSAEAAFSGGLEQLRGKLGW